MEKEFKNPEDIYADWRQTLKKPNESIFYYHPSLERIVLGLTMYEIASRPYLNKLGKAKSMQLYNMYINEMVTSWILEDEGFEYSFKSLMTLSEGFFLACKAFEEKHPALKKTIRHLQYTFGFWTSAGGDINEDKAQELLDDIETDGERIGSEKISLIVRRLQPTVVRHGMDIDPEEACRMVENDGLHLESEGMRKNCQN